MSLPPLSNKLIKVITQKPFASTQFVQSYTPTSLKLNVWVGQGLLNPYQNEAYVHVANLNAKSVALKANLIIAELIQSDDCQIDDNLMLNNFFSENETNETKASNIVSLKEKHSNLNSIKMIQIDKNSKLLSKDQAQKADNFLNEFSDLFSDLDTKLNSQS